MTEKSRPNRIYELDALRGIAALFVVLFHFTAGQKQAEYGFKFGVTGVDLFFMISGFVILMTLEKTRNWNDFVINRLSRLYPTYWACVTVTALTLLVSTDFTGSGPLKVLYDYLANMTMFQLYFNRLDIDGSYWTMIVEMLFYIFMLLTFVFGKLKNIEDISMIVLIFIAIYSYPYFQVHFKYLSFELRYHMPLINHYPLFFAGILFYKIKFDRVTLKRSVLLILCLFCQLSLFNIAGRSHLFLSFYEYVPMLCVYFVIFFLYTFNKLGFIVNNVTVFFGTISYSLYLIHQSIGNVVIIPFFTKYTSYWMAHIIALLIVVFLAFLINKTIEKPVMTYIRNKRKSKQLTNLDVFVS